LFIGWKDDSETELYNKLVGEGRDRIREVSNCNHANVMVNSGSKWKITPQEAYGVNYNKLAEIKKKYDPKNFFKGNVDFN
jgi:hypothetical protein